MNYHDLKAESDLESDITVNVNPTGDLSSDDEYVTIRPQSVRRRRILIVVGILVLLALVVLLFVRSWVASQLDPPGEPGDAIEVVIPLDSTPGQIAAILEDNDVIPNPVLFQFWATYRSFDAYQAGTYTFKTNMSADQALQIFREGPNPANVTTVTIIEGETLADFVPRLADALPEVTEADFEAALQSGSIPAEYRPNDIDSWEGLLFPDTYEISLDSSAEDVIEKLHAKLVEVASRNNYGSGEPENRFDRTPYEMLVIASMIEKEAKLDEDRAKISAVIHNRLRDQEWLDIDATAVYSNRPADDDGSFVLTFDMLEDASDPYNTSSRAGAVTRGRIPPTPISTISAKSLQAALNPAVGDWKFYVLDEDLSGRHYFSVTLDEHNRAVARWRAAEAAAG